MAPKMDVPLESSRVERWCRWREEGTPGGSDGARGVCHRGGLDEVMAMYSISHLTAGLNDYCMWRHVVHTVLTGSRASKPRHLLAL